jgi:predicted metal-binding membrane protein
LYVTTLLAFSASAAATFHFIRSMPDGMEMPGGWTMSMMWMLVADQTWLESAALFMLMWLAMMVAMMLPSAIPMLRNFRRALRARGATSFGTPLAVAACAYILVWLAVGGAVYVIGMITVQVAMRWEDFSRAMPALSGAALVAAGSYQFTRWKMAGLRHCRDPLAATQIRDGPWAGLRHGLDQGASCVASSSGSMLALLALGAMNPAVMALVAVLIAMEKLMPKPEPVVRASGFLALIAGTVMILGWLLCAAPPV